MSDSPASNPIDDSGIFGSDALMPSQYFDRIRTTKSDEPLQRLFVALLESAINDFQQNANSSITRRIRLFREAEFWLFEDISTAPFSFEDVCSALGIHPEYLRKGLKRWKVDQTYGRLCARTRIRRMVIPGKMKRSA